MIVRAPTTIERVLFFGSTLAQPGAIAKKPAQTSGKGQAPKIDEQTLREVDELERKMRSRWRKLNRSTGTK